MIEYVIESMIKGIESDIDKHTYEYNLIINICKNSYRYFKIIDKIFGKILKIYDESYEKGIMNDTDYIKMFKEIYDMMIKTKVNDVHRTIATEDEYLEYSKLLAAEPEDEEAVDMFLYQKAYEMTEDEAVKEKLDKILNPEVEETEEIDPDMLDDEDIDIDKLNLDEILGRNKDDEGETEEETEDVEDEEENDIEDEEVEEDEDEAIEEEKPKRKAGRPRKEDKPKEKRPVGRPKKNK